MTQKTNCFPIAAWTHGGMARPLICLMAIRIRNSEEVLLQRVVVLMLPLALRLKNRYPSPDIVCWWLTKAIITVSLRVGHYMDAMMEMNRKEIGK